MRKSISNVRKPEIVQAAIRAIGKAGLPMLSYDRIAEEADMSRQLIRHYFPDPEELALAVCDGLAASYRQCLAESIIKGNAPVRLSTFFDFYFRFLGDNGPDKPADDQVYDAMFALAANSEQVRKNLAEQYGMVQFTIAHEVQVANPTLNQKACREIGFLFVSLMYGHWKMVASLGFSEDYNRVSREAIDRLLQSYLDHYHDPDDDPPPDCC